MESGGPKLSGPAWLYHSMNFVTELWAATPHTSKYQTAANEASDGSQDPEQQSSNLSQQLHHECVHDYKT